MDSIRERLLVFVPDLQTVLVVGAVGVVYAFLAFAAVGQLKKRRQVRTAYTRKLFHFAVFTMASIIQLIWHVPGVMVFGLTMSLFVFYALYRGDGHSWYEAIARPSDSPHRTLFIVVPLITTAFGGFVSNLLFARYAYIGYLVCGWGDAVGEPVGSRWGKHPYRVPSLSGVPAVRTLEGSAAVFLVGSIAAVFGLMAADYSAGQALGIGLACGFAGALVEAISNHGLDNLTTQIAASAVANWLG